MANPKQVEAVKKRIQNPTIRLNEKVLKGIKGLTVDDEIEITATLKVQGVERECDYDTIMPEDGEERPKIMVARFEVMNIKNVKED
jgi:hypothetical protein